MSDTLSNWAGNIIYSAKAVHEPQSVAEVQDIVRKAGKARALGSRHSFNTIADTDADLVSMKRLDKVLQIDAAARTVTVEGGITYGQLCPALAAAGFALHNLASLPHISVAGAVTTATHGSGERNGNLATAVRALEMVTADGSLRSFKHGEPDFEGAVVGLGALGVVTAITLDIEPTYEMRQDVFTGLPFSTLVESFDALTASAYSVSLFTSWSGDTIDQLWLKSRVDAGYAFDPAAYGVAAAERRYHPIAAIGGEPCTEQGGIAGPWHERLPHFRFEFTPSNGQELQTEYFVPRRHAVEALTALRGIEERIAPHLLISEIRMIAADELWMSPNYRQDCIGIHFTWKLDWPAVRAVLPEIEARLAPFEVRPHWGKLFTLEPADVQTRYPRLGDFRRLLGEVDPGGKFRNEFVARNVFG